MDLGLAGTRRIRQVRKADINHAVGCPPIKVRDALLFGTLGMAPMISERNLRTRKESLMLSTLSCPSKFVRGVRLINSFLSASQGRFRIQRVAKANFNGVFDEWIRQHSRGIP
jgi:hypothetical protein